MLVAATGLSIAPAAGAETHSGAVSDAYAFGFVSAALTTCDGVGPEFADILSVSSDPNGRVPNEVAQGFSAFAFALDTRGAAEACVSARRMIGPGR